MLSISKFLPSVLSHKTIRYGVPKTLQSLMLDQIFNFSLVLTKGDLLDILVYVMISYFVVAVILIVVNPKGILYKKYM